MAKLHDALEQLGPVSDKHGIIGTAGITDLVKQHKDVQQQIADAKQRAAKLELVADLEKRQAHFEACLSAGVYVTSDTSKSHLSLDAPLPGRPDSVPRHACQLLHNSSNCHLLFGTCPPRWSDTICFKIKCMLAYWLMYVILPSAYACSHACVPLHVPSANFLHPDLTTGGTC